ncbi:hypothetical protein rpr22_0631 [Rickettsia prowazekii str. Rp22]|uniref:Uncharacterized protein n=1 Tax=Rickettsia prowazekii (strain Rp22) TaxID=449216 RepID=D5AXK2_RICPP|nr:hypothetical protein rpr22_0631 [Rickettsia prowazekii str. Rp22]
MTQINFQKIREAIRRREEYSIVYTYPYNLYEYLTHFPSYQAY